MVLHSEISVRLFIAAQLLAMGFVRFYFGAQRAKEVGEARPARRAESVWFSATLAVIALLHFGALIAYLLDPALIRWSAFQAGFALRWVGIAISCFGVGGEIWAALSLGASYSPMLRVADERVVITAGPYGWIRHPLYAFWIPVMIGWSLAARSWFILVSGTVLVLVLRLVRVPREEAMMIDGFGESYRQYMIRTGRFVPRLRSAAER